MDKREMKFIQPEVITLIKKLVKHHKPKTHKFQQNLKILLPIPNLPKLIEKKKRKRKSNLLKEDKYQSQI